MVRPPLWATNDRVYFQIKLRSRWMDRTTTRTGETEEKRSSIQKFCMDLFWLLT